MPFLLPFALPLLVFGAIAGIDYLRNKPNESAPKPLPKENPYTPPFLGGQCLVSYNFVIRLKFQPPNGGVQQFTTSGSVSGAIQGVSGSTSPSGTFIVTVFSSTGNHFSTSAFGGFGGANEPFVTLTLENIVRGDGLPDNCGNLPNPDGAQAINEDGLFTPVNEPPSEAAIVVAPALPIALVAAIFTAAKAALDAAAASASALEAIKKVAEAMQEWNKLFEKLSEFLDEWEKNRPEKRTIQRQTYGAISGDGAIDFYFTGNEDYVAIQLDVVITDIPVGYGKYFATNSPYRYPYKKLGYIAFYSNTLGIISVHELEFRRTALEIPKNAVGFVYHLGLDGQVQGYAFGSFSVKQ